MENQYTPPLTRTVQPKERNSYVSSFVREKSNPIRFTVIPQIGYTTIIPPVDHLRTKRDFMHLEDRDISSAFTNYNASLRSYVVNTKMSIEERLKTNGVLSREDISECKSISRDIVGYINEHPILVFFPSNKYQSPTPKWRRQLNSRLLKAIRRIKNK